MTSSSQPSISSYQSAILTEMGISTWTLAPVNQMGDTSEVSNSEEARPLPIQNTSSVSKENALSKLQQLKSKQAQFKETTSVLTTFTRDEISSQLFSDVLLALELSTDKLQHIEPGRQSDYKGYPIALIKGDQVNLDNKQLLTPSLDLLKVNPDVKKRLWNTLQIAKTTY